jgi:hypothetical protein
VKLCARFQSHRPYLAARYYTFTSASVHRAAVRESLTLCRYLASTRSVCLQLDRLSCVGAPAAKRSSVRSIRIVEPACAQVGAPSNWASF